MEEDTRSADDLLEEARGGRRDSVGGNPLDEDNDPPASPPVGRSRLWDNHQLLDSDIDAHELYDEGFDSAAGSRISERV